MSYTIPTVEPRTIVIGDTVKWKRSLPDYPADEFTLSYAFTDSDGNQFTVTASADGTDHLVSESTATTGAYTAGDYQWQAYVTEISSSERFTIGSGYSEIVPNYASAAVDDRSHARATLDAIKAMIAGKATSDQASMSIAGRSLSRYSVEEILRWRSHYEALVEREERAADIAAGRPSRGKVRIRFLN